MSYKYQYVLFNHKIYEVFIIHLKILILYSSPVLAGGICSNNLSSLKENSGFDWYIIPLMIW